MGLSIKDIKLSNVDFPDPDGPINAYIFPLLKLYDRFFKTLIFFSVLKCLEIFFNLKNYSYFNALIGSKFAALNAGKIETIIVINIEQIDINNIEDGLISEGIVLKK